MLRASFSLQVEAAKKAHHAACKEEKLAISREANSKADPSLNPEQLKKLQDKIEKCKQDVLKVRHAFVCSWGAGGSLVLVSGNRWGGGAGRKINSSESCIRMDTQGSTSPLHSPMPTSGEWAANQAEGRRGACAAHGRGSGQGFISQEEACEDQ